MSLDKIWDIFKLSFPSNERRSYENQKKLFTNPRYRCKIYEENACVKAFICYWEFDDFYFIEHFAVNPEYRNNGLGSKIMNHMKGLGKALYLEVERPSDLCDLPEKRIRFYEKLGFELNNYFYEQPPLNDGDDYLEMKMMSYPDPMSHEQFLLVRDTIYKYVYC